MKLQFKAVLIVILILKLNPVQSRFNDRHLHKKIISTSFKNKKVVELITLKLEKDTIPNILMGTISLSDEFNAFLFVEKNVGINVFKFEVPSKGNIILNGFVSAGTNRKMLYSRLIKNGKIISEKSCGIGNPLFNGQFNYQALVNKGDKLSIQILVQDSKWQLHCCPDLYNCTYILTKTNN